ncbi:MAG TPA: hypothetical protein VGS58_08790 [Candidatus Sulfopaludibacter sp.]|nr:hypothetical protein [Candidatus Sulfopaludibacter sp.]
MTDKRLAANRANARRSTGPRTSQGKARSAQNAVRHGFAAAAFAVVRLEEVQEVDCLKADLIATCHPVNPQELHALERAALAQHAIFRAARLESGLFTVCLNTALSRSDSPFIPMTEHLCGDLHVTREQNRNYALASGFDQMARTPATFNLFLRYQAQAERLCRRAVEEFNRLKALRGNLPNEPISAHETKPNQPDTSNETNPIETLVNLPAQPPEDVETPAAKSPGIAGPKPPANRAPSPIPMPPKPGNSRSHAATVRRRPEPAPSDPELLSKSSTSALTPWQFPAGKPIAPMPILKA